MVQSKNKNRTKSKKIDNQKKHTKSKSSKKQKVVNDVPRQNVKVTKEQRKKQINTIVIVTSVVIVLLAISCRNSQIDKAFTQIQEQKKVLAALQKENEQLKVSIENSLNLNNIEKIAKEELGMQKITGRQTVYIALPKKDYVESASEKIVMEEEKSWFDELIEKIFDF